MEKKILVTGANGQLGKTILELFFKNNMGLDFVFRTKQNLDITNIEEIEDFFSENKFDYCINCAAYTNVEQAEKTPEIAYQINAFGVKNLAKMCRRYDTILIHISTDYVFDGKKTEPYLVTDTPNPINEYGKSKLIGEQNIEEVLDNYFIIRTSWLYSKNYGKNFYRAILEKAKKEKEMYITDEQIGCPTDTINLSRFIIDLITKKNEKYGVHHFCDNKIMTWFGFAEYILKKNQLFNSINLVKVDKYVTFAKRPKNSILK